jgi:hypothetical protein
MRENKSLKGLRKTAGISVYPFLLGRKMVGPCKHETFPYTVLKFGTLHTVLKISIYQGIIMQNINRFTATCYYRSDAPRRDTMLCANTDVMH